MKKTCFFCVFFVFVFFFLAKTCFEKGFVYNFWKLFFIVKNKENKKNKENIFGY